jgi:hypothetical protein
VSPSSSRGPTSTERSVLAILAAAAIALGGCGGGDSGTGHGNGGRPFVLYTKRGGIAGVNEELRCSPKWCQLDEAGDPFAAGPLGSQEAERLRDAFDRAGFERLESETGTPCADCFRYRIAYAGHVVRTEQSALPDELRPVIADLDALVARIRRGNT